jgi:hypothetical protein
MLLLCMEIKSETIINILQRQALLQILAHIDKGNYSHQQTQGFSSLDYFQVECS